MSSIPGGCSSVPKPEEHMIPVLEGREDIGSKGTSEKHRRGGAVLIMILSVTKMLGIYRWGDAVIP